MVIRPRGGLETASTSLEIAQKDILQGIRSPTDTGPNALVCIARESADLRLARLLDIMVVQQTPSQLDCVTVVWYLFSRGPRNLIGDHRNIDSLKLVQGPCRFCCLAAHNMLMTILLTGSWQRDPCMFLALTLPQWLSAELSRCV
ncbi:hypothetical protein BV25DRAFT_1826800, partial [Artomyces pyxidatus]